MLWLTALIVLTSAGGLSVPELLGLFYGGAGLLLVWLVLIVSARRQCLPVQLRATAAAPLLLLLGAGLLATDSTLLVRFLPSRAALDQYVAKVRMKAPARQESRRVGLFTARETEVLPAGVVRIITAENMFDDAGLVFAPSGAPPVLGEDVYVRIGAGWWRWRRSW